MKKKLLPSIFITLLGTALILWGAGRIALGIIGEPEKAVITHIRREGGERTDIKPGQKTEQPISLDNIRRTRPKETKAN